MKNYRLTNKRRFISFLITVTLLSIVIVSFLIPNECQGMQEQKYVEVKVVSGDTLWELAEQYGGNDLDKREFIYEIMKLNNLKEAKLFAGQILRIPLADERI